MKKYNSARAEKSMGLILGLGSSGSRLIKNHKVKYLDTAEFENIRIEGADSYVVGHDASDFDRVSLRRLLDSISRVLLVTFGGGKAGGEMTSFAALHALSKKMPVHVVLSYPQLWEGSRRARNAIALHEELKAKGATVSIIDGRKISDIEFEEYEQEFAVLDSLMLKEVGLWAAAAQGHGQ
jgi:cell division GTPase FtsZ